MFRRVKKVLVAVSGGPDSVACMLTLREFGLSEGFEVEACHFDHQLRPESKNDLEYVRSLCAEIGVECVSGEGDVAGVARQQKRGVEEVAREMRYQFLAFVAEKQQADCIATGHTSDDQAETVLMRIVRGSGIRGIRGMLPVSPVPGSEAQRLIRPLLTTPREATERICAEWNVVPVADVSNADVRFTRNRVRLETLRALREVNPSVNDALVGLGESARAAFEPVERRSFEVQPRERGPVGAIFATQPLAGLPAEALGLVLEREASFYHLRPEVNRTRFENARAMLAKGTGSVRFGEVALEASCGVTRLGPVLETVEPFEPAILNVPGSTRAGPWRVDVRTDPLESTPEAPAVAIGSADVAGALRARPLRPGDRMLIRGLERKVSDLLGNEKVPAWERVGMVAVGDSKGVVAIFGATRSFARDAAEADLWIKLSAIQPPR